MFYFLNIIKKYPEGQRLSVVKNTCPSGLGNERGDVNSGMRCSEAITKNRFREED
jgi:hypothetical protein